MKWLLQIAQNSRNSLTLKEMISVTRLENSEREEAFKTDPRGRMEQRGLECAKGAAMKEHKEERGRHR